MTKRIAITGATGFIGGYMVKGLARAGHQVRALVRPGRQSALVKPEVGLPVEFHEGDLTQPETIEGFLKDVDILLHLASAHDHFPEEVMKAVNITGTTVLLDEAKKNARKGFEIWVVSSAVIGTPTYSYYRDSKRVQEKLIRGSGIPWASFRPTLVYGIGDMRHTAYILRKLSKKRGIYPIPHSGKSKINPVHVEDVVDAVLRYFDFDRGVDCVYELAGPEGIPYNDFIRITMKAAGGNMKIMNFPKKWVDRLIFLKGFFTDVTEDRRGSSYFMLHHDHNISNAWDELGWRPRPYAEGIVSVAAGDWWRHGELLKL